jgi:hypothetical protein
MWETGDGLLAAHLRTKALLTFPWVIFSLVVGGTGRRG